MNDVSPRFRPVLDTVPAYKPGQAPTAAAGEAHKLSSNESPYGPLPSVVEVIAEAARAVNRYPDNGAAAQPASRPATASPASAGRTARRERAAP